jgi:hypothetical protein
VGLLPGTNQPGQQGEQDAIRLCACWPFHLSLKNDELLAKEDVFCDQLGLASAKVSEGGQRQGGPERFGPTSPREKRAHPSSQSSAAGDKLKHLPYKKLLHHMKRSLSWHEDAVDGV